MESKGPFSRAPRRLLVSRLAAAKFAYLLPRAFHARQCDGQLRVPRDPHKRAGQNAVSTKVGQGEDSSGGGGWRSAASELVLPTLTSGFQ